jgi:hypothetical protein
MASTQIPDRRRTLRYRNLLIKADSGDQEPDIGTAGGNWGGLQQAPASQGGLIRRSDVNQQKGRPEYPAATEAEPGDD